MASTVSGRATVQWAGLVAGPVLAGVCFLLLPETYRDTAGALVEFTTAGRVTLAILTWMAVWWLTEAIDIAATALIPIALLPALGAATIGEATAPYADSLIFLFLGGFLLALSMQRWGLDRRIALVTLRFTGDRPAGIVGGVMLATAVMSMFVSNTATAAMMLPIALSVVTLLRGQTLGTDPMGTDPVSDRRGAICQRPPPEEGSVPMGSVPIVPNNFAICMMLGIAYAASIGGIGTKIGTPPNGLVLGFIEQNLGRSIGFGEWMVIAMPLVAVFLPVTWLLLTRVLYPVPPARIAGARDLLRDEYGRLGPAKPGEWATFIVFILTALAWITRPWLLPRLSDSGIVIIAALALFVIPVNVRDRTFTMNWDTARTLPWGILVLFGGGLSLAAAVKANGVAEFIGTSVTAFGGAVPALLVVLVVVTTVILLTELTSNTATTATLVPILAALAPGLDVSPYLLIVPAAMAASCAFMMPVATPPNAIVFGSGHLTIPTMCKAGLWLNLIGIVLITVLAFAVIGPRLGG